MLHAAMSKDTMFAVGKPRPSTHHMSPAHGLAMRMATNAYPGVQITYLDRGARYWLAQNTAATATYQSHVAALVSWRLSIAVRFRSAVSESLVGPRIRPGVTIFTLQRRSDSISVGVTAFILLRTPEQRLVTESSASLETKYRVHARQTWLGSFVASHCECTGEVGW